MILSQTAVYAVKATLYLAESGEDPVRVEDIARSLAVPRNYLAKILNVLGHTGVLASVRGRTGGFSLARDSRDVTLAEVIAPFDDIGGSSGCLLGGERCSDAAPCAAHAHWKQISASVRDFLDRTTVEDLACAEGPPHSGVPLPAPPLP